jgi:hypothetical protein
VGKMVVDLDGVNEEAEGEGPLAWSVLDLGILFRSWVCFGLFLVGLPVLRVTGTGF